jgi:hypothetical protein
MFYLPGKFQLHASATEFCVRDQWFSITVTFVCYIEYSHGVFTSSNYITEILQFFKFDITHYQAL